MAELLEYNSLKRYIWRPGPYIYYYDNKKERKNQDIVDYVDEMACKFSTLKVFKIDWCEKVMNKNFISPDEINKIYLYFEGRKKEELFIDNRETIDYLFYKAIEYYNIHVEKKVANLGSRPFSNAKLKPIEHKIITKPRIRYPDTILRNRQTYLLKKKIEIPDHLKAKFSKFNNITECKNNYLYKYNVEQACYINKRNIITNKNSLKPKWFHDVSVSDLPIDIISDHCKKFSESENSNENQKLNVGNSKFKSLQSYKLIEKFKSNIKD